MGYMSTRDVERKKKVGERSEKSKDERSGRIYIVIARWAEDSITIKEERYGVCESNPWVTCNATIVHAQRPKR